MFTNRVWRRISEPNKGGTEAGEYCITELHDLYYKISG
jgi:hypothetical protein